MAPRTAQSAALRRLSAFASRSKACSQQFWVANNLYAIGKARSHLSQLPAGRKAAGFSCPRRAVERGLARSCRHIAECRRAGRRRRSLRRRSSQVRRILHARPPHFPRSHFPLVCGRSRGAPIPAGDDRLADNNRQLAASGTAWSVPFTSFSARLSAMND